MALQHEDLADFIRRVRNKAGLSVRDVASRSGGGISHGYVSQIENRSVLGGGISPDRLIALARGLGVSENELFAIARGKPLSEIEALESQVLVMFGQLPKERQEDVLLMIRALLGAHGIKPAVMEKRKSKSKRAA